MKRVYKYPVETGRFSHRMPGIADPLTVMVQNGEPQMWAIVDVEQPESLHHFVTIPTGVDAPDNVGRHVGSFQINNEWGTLVFHVFVLGSEL